LVSAGLAPGDRIAACLPNELDIVVAFYAAARIGAIWVGINRQLAAPEKGRLLEDATPRILLAEPETLVSLQARTAALELEQVAVDGDRWAQLCSAPRPHTTPSIRRRRPRSRSPAARAAHRRG
jgi:acyl-coenzyme A synthetase/AMP-(fatty) acid ligase